MSKVEMSQADKVYRYVASQIVKLSTETSGAKASLARLRRALGKDPIDTPDVWYITMASDDIPSEVDGVITKEGRAIHIALTLYSLSMQGTEIQGSNQKGDSFGEALSKLANRGEMAYGSIQMRFNKMIGTKDVLKLSKHARGFIGVFKKSGIMLDYAGFAKDLYNYQWPEGYKATRVKWATKFYTGTDTTKNKDGGNENES